VLTFVPIEKAASGRAEHRRLPHRVAVADRRATAGRAR
jgi:hypothetical protein